MFEVRLYPRTIGTRYATFDAAPCEEAGELPVRPPPTKLIARVQEEDRARDEKREFEADEGDRVPLGGRDGKLSARVGVDTLLRQVQDLHWKAAVEDTPSDEAPEGASDERDEDLEPSILLATADEGVEHIGCIDEAERWLRESDPPVAGPGEHVELSPAFNYGWAVCTMRPSAT